MTPSTNPAAEAVLNPLALEALENNQRQLDMDGVEVGVSRQALDELLAAYKAAVARVNRATDAEIGGIHRSLSAAPAPASGVDAVNVDALAKRMWRVTPREVRDSGLTRSQWYAREIRAAFNMGKATHAEEQWRLWEARAFAAENEVVRLHASLSPAATSGSEAGGELNWRSIDNAPEDEWLLVATTGGWVGEATVIDGEWKWASGHVFHSDIVPQKWMPLPRHPDVATEAVACLTDAEQKEQAARCACRGADDYCQRNMAQGGARSHRQGTCRSGSRYRDEGQESRD